MTKLVAINELLSLLKGEIKAFSGNIQL